MEKSQESNKDMWGHRVNTAFIQLKRGESKEEAWDRHLKEKPGDRCANVKVFYQ